MNYEFIKKIEELLNNKHPFVISTITKFIGSTPRQTGTKMITYLNQQGSAIFGTIGGGKLEFEVTRDAAQMIEKNGISTIKEYSLDESHGMSCGGTVEVFHEITNKQNDLYIFGAGHVGQALSRALTGGPFTIHVIDERSEWALSEKIPESIVRHNIQWDKFTASAKWDGDTTFVVVMTHDHKYDTQIVEDILKRKSRYLGLMGSKNKWSSSKNYLLNKNISETCLNSVICPIGDKRLGQTPTEIAIGIAAQLLSLLNKSK